MYVVVPFGLSSLFSSQLELSHSGSFFSQAMLLSFGKIRIWVG